MPTFLRSRTVTGHILRGALGFGFLESVYRRALAIELRARGHRCAEEGLIEVQYKGVVVGAYRFDLLVDDRVLVEAKSGEALAPTAKRQLLNYLRAKKVEVGLLLHFGSLPRCLRCAHQKSLMRCKGPCGRKKRSCSFRGSPFRSALRRSGHHEKPSRTMERAPTRSALSTAPA